MSPPDDSVTEPENASVPAAFDPMAELGMGMRPLPEGTDKDRLDAAMDILQRSGVIDIEVGYDDAYAEGVNWYATCRVRQQFGGIEVPVRGMLGPVEAAERLARKLLNGSTCTHCGRIMTLEREATPADQKWMDDLDHVCRWAREGKRWERGCRETHVEGARQATIIEDFLRRGGVKKRGS